MPSLMDEFYGSVGFVGYNKKFTKVKNEPIPSTNVNWPTLEEERELAWNKMGWFDPRDSRRWDIMLNKQQEVPAAKHTEIPKPAAADNKQTMPAPENQQAVADKSTHSMGQTAPVVATAPEQEQQKLEQKPMAEKPNAPEAAKPAKPADPAQQAPAPKQILPPHLTNTPDAAAPKPKFADLFNDDHKQASHAAKKVDQAANSVDQATKATEGQNKPIEEPKVAGQEQHKAAEPSNIAAKAPEQAVVVAPKNGTDTPNNGTDAPKGAVEAPLPAKEAPSKSSKARNVFDDGVAWPSLEEERELVANKAGWFDPRYSRRWNGVHIASIPAVFEAILDVSEEADP